MKQSIESNVDGSGTGAMEREEVMLFPQLSCPACGSSALSRYSSGVECSSCGNRLPQTPRGALIALADPVGYLRSTASDLIFHRARLDKLVTALDQAQVSMPWRSSPSVLTAALKARMSRADSEIDDLKQVLAGLDAPFPDAQANDVSWGAGFTDFIYYDWSSQPFAMAQRDTLTDCVLSMVADHAKDAKVPMLLGGGAGRHFFDLAKHMPTLVGCDLDYTYVDCYFRLLEDSLLIHDIHAPMISSNTVVTSELATLPDDRPPNARNYFVGDATHLPVADKSIDCAISIYLTDCVPLPVLLTEMQRILSAGGTFISAGPLIYRDVDPAHWYTPDEVMKLAKDWGFECEHSEWIELPFWHSPYRASKRIHKVWAYVLRKIERSEG